MLRFGAAGPEPAAGSRRTLAPAPDEPAGRAPKRDGTRLVGYR
jgi:hypothetical protein